MPGLTLGAHHRHGIYYARQTGGTDHLPGAPLRLAGGPATTKATAERIARLDDQTAFINLATSRKRKNDDAAAREIEEGRALQDAIRAALATLEGKGRYMDREVFEADLAHAAKRAGVKIAAPIKKAIYGALGERDLEAEICSDSKGRPEPDSELRDTENIPLPEGTALPLPMQFGPDRPNEYLVAAFRGVIDAYMTREVLPHVSDAWVDYDKTKVGYEIPINRHFYAIEVGGLRLRQISFRRRPSHSAEPQYLYGFEGAR